jgi:hypothetical protein
MITVSFDEMAVNQRYGVRRVVDEESGAAVWLLDGAADVIASKRHPQAGSYAFSTGEEATAAQAKAEAGGIRAKQLMSYLLHAPERKQPLIICQVYTRVRSFRVTASAACARGAHQACCMSYVSAHCMCISRCLAAYCTHAARISIASLMSVLPLWRRTCACLCLSLFPSLCCVLLGCMHLGASICMLLL